MRKAVLALLALGVLAGCAGLPTGGSDLPSGMEAREGYAALDAVEGTVEYGYDAPANASNTTVVRVVERPTEGLTRQRFRAPDRLAGDVTVVNDTTYWRYDESENEVTRTTLGDDAANASNAGFVARVFGNLSESGERSIVANPQLPVGPLGTDRGGATPITADLAGGMRLDVSYVGTETIAGREAYGVELVPANATAADGPSSQVENATYWFDAEYFHPLRTEVALSIGEGATTHTREYRSVTFNPDVAPGRFRFDPPPNATVETPADREPATFGTAAAAEANVSFDVATADADGFELETASVNRVQNRTTVSLRYANATDEFTVASRRPPFDSSLGNESVSLGAVNATAGSILDTNVLRWRCGGTEYTVRSELPRDALADIATGAATVCAAA